MLLFCLWSRVTIPAMVSRKGGAQTDSPPPVRGSLELAGDPKFLRLVELLRGYVAAPVAHDRDVRGTGRVIVAYSGGVDSAFLLKVATDLLGDRALGVLAFSESLDRNEYIAARRVADAMGVSIRVIETREYDNAEYRRNDGRRCYHCKSELFSRLLALAASEGFDLVLDGSNFDDQDDYRPGMQARRELGVRSPLLEAGLTKHAIRSFSKALGLPTWDKPAAPCLASRIPYGSEVTHEKLRQVEAAEAGLRGLGFRVVRVRHHGTEARVEIPTEDFSRFMESPVRERALQALLAAGFRDVTLDLRGYRSGSLNEALEGSSSPSAASPVLGPLVQLSEIRRPT